LAPAQALSKGDLLNLGALGGVFGAESKSQSTHKILDTSVIIDGRIAISPKQVFSKAYW